MSFSLKIEFHHQEQEFVQTSATCDYSDVIQRRAALGNLNIPKRIRSNLSL